MLKTNKYTWEPSSNGKAGHENLYVENAHGERFLLAKIHPSNSQDPGMGVTLIKRDVNYGLDGKFIPQGDGRKEWNLAVEGAKDRGIHFAQEQVDSAFHLVGRQIPAHQREAEPEHDMAQER